jgi:tRNA(adenine34) deaminase
MSDHAAPAGDELNAALDPALGPGPSPEDERWMALALKEAARAYEEGEVPVGAVIVAPDGRLLGKAHNQREALKDPTAHAEMIAITQAAHALDSWRLADAILYVTLEPCPMCAGALVNARLGRLVFGAWDPKAGACGTLYDIARDRRLNHRVPTTGGVLARECGEILKAFFRERRQAGEA